MEFSLKTLECPGLAIGVSTGVCVECKGEGVDLDNGLLLCIDTEPRTRARVRLPSIFYNGTSISI